MLPGLSGIIYCFAAQTLADVQWIGSRDSIGEMNRSLEQSLLQCASQTRANSGRNKNYKTSSAMRQHEVNQTVISRRLRHRPFTARWPLRCHPRHSLHVVLSNPDGFVEAAIGAHVSVIHAHEPAVAAAASANPPFLKERCEALLNGGILSVSG